jgi:hypothetical protein
MLLVGENKTEIIKGLVSRMFCLQLEENNVNTFERLHMEIKSPREMVS